jgi:Na+-driven multidrug efflux pump
LAEQGGKISDGLEIGLDGATLALYSGLNLQVGKGLRLDRKPVSEAVALGLPSFVVRSAERGATLNAILFSKTIGTTRKAAP